jgi:hypothetical protein
LNLVVFSKHAREFIIRHASSLSAKGRAASANLEHQQNLGAFPIAVSILVAPTNRIQSLRPLIPTSSRLSRP